MEKNQYIKISEKNHDNGFIVAVQEAKLELDSMLENAFDGDEPVSFNFTVVFMTEQEFEELPEFQGF